MSDLIRHKQLGRAWETAVEAGGGGGSSVVRGPFFFAFDTPGLADGVALYTPTVDDVLLDLWIEVDTSWDNSSPAMADLGTFVDQTYGLFASGDGPVNLVSNTDTETVLGTGVLSQGSHMGWPASDGMLVAAAATPSARFLPARFTAANPLMLVVSQDGTIGGTPAVSATGAGRVYLVTATPVAF